MEDREPTGIPGFDDLIEGGFPRGSVTLVSGSPGTGKSIFAQHFVHTGASKFKQKVMYISLEQRVSDIYEQALRFGFDFGALEKQGAAKFEFIDITSRKGLPGQTIIEDIRNRIRQFNPKRIVIDSLSPLANIPPSVTELQSYGLIEGDVFQPSIPPELYTRFQVHRLIMMLKELPGTTSIIISEIPRGSEWLSSDKISEFMSDGVVVLHYLGAMETATRYMVIEKMRSTKHQENLLPIDIGDRGIILKKSEEGLFRK
jgi:KaiC/GvpD/RAD55 family RecA-like ATPase